MGRNKISIQKIKDNRIRNITFCKRKKGIIKMAMELCLLCDADIFLCIYNKQISLGQLILFCSNNDIDYFIDKFYKKSIN